MAKTPPADDVMVSTGEQAQKLLELLRRHAIGLAADRLLDEKVRDNGLRAIDDAITAMSRLAREADGAAREKKISDGA